MNWTNGNIDAHFQSFSPPQTHHCMKWTLLKYWIVCFRKCKKNDQLQPPDSTVGKMVSVSVHESNKHFLCNILRPWWSPISLCILTILLCWLTFGFRPRLPLTFLKDLTGFLLFERSSAFSGMDVWLSTFTRPPLFFESSSGCIRGSTPPFDMVTPRRS